MAKVLICTGKKKRVLNVLDYFQKLEKAKKIRILSKRIYNKKILIWGYEELRLLFEQLEDGGDIKDVPKEVRRGLDLLSIRDQAVIQLEFESFQKEDNMMRAKILTLSHNFVRRNVRIKVSEEQTKHSQYRIDYKCLCKLAGPAKEVFQFKEMLVKEKLCNPKTLKYIF